NLDQEDREVVNQKFDIGAVVRSRMFLSIVGFIFICVSVRACWNGLLTVGVEQGYRPVQPIPFSHKQHAGQYKINCNYCHTGVNKGKQANIPSLNICMNCHSQIKKGPRFGEDAIGKVIKAYNENKPIKWVRVHNLPDLAYFNHAQHVNVGGLECTNCHGPIDTMEVVHQVSPLTMGWCINCHRETSVNGKDNAYYDKLLELHNKVSKKELKVADIGGLECSKCHY
ncbi:MAG TPA: cytochrome c3 family protein, partial [Cytophagaceae bacterium]